MKPAGPVPKTGYSGRRRWVGRRRRPSRKHPVEASPLSRYDQLKDIHHLLTDFYFVFFEFVREPVWRRAATTSMRDVARDYRDQD